MKRNIGDIDAIVRIMIGFVLAYYYYITAVPTVWQSLGLILAGLLMVTAVNGTCPFYRICKINSLCKSCSTSKSKECNTDCETKDEK